MFFIVAKLGCTIHMQAEGLLQKNIKNNWVIKMNFTYLIASI